ncbi:hypothetical protein PR202_gb14914 [Eleusine coracana subsp. coracana]|uniref:Bet v I/Major latex protein domain-containing protein n=1 Tax=Eleusine coracana subsp. coracana TaxID=191504 RepID=A0AAV5EWA4_ELECO|nr:hypothetical protein QOZ80_4BG0340790 [Eleusine coracana subsp. coracana]GJN26945.1 hypothetical protein PR202_gb14914 [Eleusine coracana subsp. coracana]
MASKISTVFEVKSPADKLWAALQNSTELLPKIFPELYKSIETVEGDGKSVGSVRLLKYADGVPMTTFAKEKVELADEENKVLPYSEEVPAPDFIKDTAAKSFRDLDEYLLNN